VRFRIILGADLAPRRSASRATAISPSRPTTARRGGRSLDCDPDASNKEEEMKGLQLLLVAALAAAVGAFAVANVFAGSAGERTIRLVERGGTFGFVDNAPTGNERTKLISAGDFSAGTVKLYDKSGKRAGSLHVVCVATVSGQEVHAKFQCNGTVQLADGTLALSALNERRADQDVDHIAVVGGTGAYRGARGNLVATSRPSGNVSDDVIRLLP
jgi:hypothetical protein